MPPRRRSANPAIDVDALRAKLDAGKTARVGIAPSGQFPDGATGLVRRVGDPDLDGPEFLLVEVKVGATKDVIPFAPGDLTPSSQRRRPGDAASPHTPAGAASVAGHTRPTATTATATAPPAGSTRPAAPTSSAPAPPAESARPTPTPATEAGAPTRPTTTAAGAAPTPAISGAQRPAGPADRPPAADRPRRSARPGSAPGGPVARGRALPAVTITVASDPATGEWTVQAKVGARVTVRGSSISPAGVAEIARGLGDPALIAAVDRLLAQRRDAVQARADALAAELAAVRAQLATFAQA